MRINKYIALATGMSRRAADVAIGEGRVAVNGQPAMRGQEVAETDRVTIDNQQIGTTTKTITIMLNKPVGYVVSRDGQGSKTIYDLLPPEYQGLKPVGRLDKDSSGLLLLTNDGELAHALTHPSFQKEKVYEVEINRSLSQKDFENITKSGVDIGEKTLSRFQLEARIMNQESGNKTKALDSYFAPLTSAWLATLTEGKNRQIRRTFATLGYTVTKLHRIQFGRYVLPSNLQTNGYLNVSE